MSNIRLFFSETFSLYLIGKLDKSQSHYLLKVMRIKEKEVFSFERIFPITLTKFFLGPKNEITNKITKIDQKIMNKSPIWYSIGTCTFTPAIKISNFSRGKV